LAQVGRGALARRHRVRSTRPGPAPPPLKRKPA
jgi:hypothetical protein